MPLLAEWTQQPKDFHGVPFGANEEAVRKVLDPDQKKSAANCHTIQRDRMCDESFKIGDVQVIASYWLTDDAMRTVHVTFSGKDFAFIRSAFIERYGDPESEMTEEWRNRAGSSYQNVVLKWRGDLVQIQLFQRGARRDDGVAILSYVPWLEKQVKRDSDAAKEASRKF